MSTCAKTWDFREMKASPFDIELRQFDFLAPRWTRRTVGSIIQPPSSNIEEGIKGKGVR